MQNWKKGCVFGHIDKFWKEHDRQIKKNACKNAYLGSIFIPEKYMIRVFFVSPWTSLIPPLVIRVPPPPGLCSYSGSDPGIFKGHKHFLRRKVVVSGRPHTVRCPVAAKLRGRSCRCKTKGAPVAAKIGGACSRGASSLNLPLQLLGHKNSHSNYKARKIPRSTIYHPTEFQVQGLWHFVVTVD